MVRRLFDITAISIANMCFDCCYNTTHMHAFYTDTHCVRDMCVTCYINCSEHLLLPSISFNVTCHVLLVGIQTIYTCRMSVDLKLTSIQKSFNKHTLVIGPSQLRNFIRTMYKHKENNKFFLKVFCLETNSSIYFVHIEMDAIDFCCCVVNIRFFCVCVCLC